MDSSTGTQRLVALCLFLFSAHVAFPQEKGSGELYLKFSSLPSDTAKVNAIHDILESEYKEEEVLSLANEALRLADSLKYEKGIALSVYYIGKIHGAQREYDLGRQNLNKALDFAQELGDEKLKARVLLELAINFHYQYEVDSALAYYERVQGLLDSLSFPFLQAETNYNLATLFNEMGDNPEALEYALKSERYYEEVLGVQSPCDLLNLLGIIYDEMSNQSLAFEYYYKALESAKSSFDAEGEVTVINNLAILYDEVGDDERAKEHYWSAIEKAHILGLDDVEAYLHNNLGEIYLSENDTLKAHKALSKSYKIFRTSDSECELAYVMDGLGLLFYKEGRYDSSSWYYQRSIELGEACQDKPLLSTVYRHLGQLFVSQSNFSRGVSLLKESLKLAKEVDIVSEIKDTNFELYRTFKKLGNVSEALRFYEDYQSNRESLMTEAEAVEVARVTSNFELQKKLLNLDYRRQADFMRLETELDQQQSDMNGLYAVIALTAILALTLARAYFLLQRQNRKLQQINEEKNTLMGVVAHDLRSPLNNIKGILTLASMEDASKGESQYTKMLNDSVDHMRDMIDRVMDISAVEDMKVNLNLIRSDLGQLVHQTAQSYEYVASKKGISISNSVKSGVYFSKVDPKYTNQVFDNLMSNAIKYSNSGTKIKLSIEEEADGIVVNFKDQGLGISQEDQAKLFTRYQTLSARPTGNEESIGLGLSIVKKFVDAMGGQISCESELGEGSTFKVRFVKV